MLAAEPCPSARVISSMPALPRLTLRRLIGAAVLAAASVVGCSQLDSWQRQTIFSPQSEPQTWWREPAKGTQVYDLALANGDRFGPGTGKARRPTRPPCCICMARAGT